MEATEDIKVILMKISSRAMSKVFWDLKSLGLIITQVKNGESLEWVYGTERKECKISKVTGINNSGKRKETQTGPEFHALEMVSTGTETGRC